MIDVSSKSWRNMFKLEMHLHTRQDKQGMRGKRWFRRCRRCAGERRSRRRRALENVDEGRCCWASALVQVPGQPWPPALI